MKKLKGVTILESVIAMIITSIIMGMGVIFYLGITKTMQQHKNMQDKIAAAQRLFFQLKADWDNATMIFKNDNMILCNGTNKIQYQFDQHEVIRMQNEFITDTFRYEKIDFYSFFIDDSLNTTKPPVRKIILDLTTDGTSYNFELLKNYPAAIMVNYSEHGH